MRRRSWSDPLPDFANAKANLASGFPNQAAAKAVLAELERLEEELRTVRIQKGRFFSRAKEATRANADALEILHERDWLRKRNEQATMEFLNEVERIRDENRSLREENDALRKRARKARGSFYDGTIARSRSV